MSVSLPNIKGPIQKRPSHLCGGGNCIAYAMPTTKDELKQQASVVRKHCTMVHKKKQDK